MLTNRVPELSTPRPPVVAAAFASTIDTMGSIERPNVGEPAPDFTLPDSKGAPWHLSDHRGHPVVLIFHRHID